MAGRRGDGSSDVAGESAAATRGIAMRGLRVGASRRRRGDGKGGTSSGAVFCGWRSTKLKAALSRRRGVNGAPGGGEGNSKLIRGVSESTNRGETGRRTTARPLPPFSRRGASEAKHDRMSKFRSKTRLLLRAFRRKPSTPASVWCLVCAGGRPRGCTRHAAGVGVPARAVMTISAIISPIRPTLWNARGGRVERELLFRHALGGHHPGPRGLAAPRTAASAACNRADQHMPWTTAAEKPMDGLATGRRWRRL